jgi:hypothetical protein
MIKVFKAQDWNASFAYAPPLVDKAVNLDEVSTAQVCDSRGEGPWMNVRMRNGESFIAQGRPQDLVQ